MFVACYFVINKLKSPNVAGDDGADEDVHYVAVDQNLDQSPEEPKASFADEGKPLIINISFINFATIFAYDCC
jgi:hypothetical protein